MLTEDQIKAIIDKRVIDIAGDSGAIGGVIGGITSSPASAVGGMLGGSSGAKAGAKFGLKFTKIVSCEEKITVPVIDNAAITEKISNYFVGNLKKTENNDGSIYFIGLKGAGFGNLNPCLFEITLKNNEITVLAHAREGLIKQKTSQKAVADLRKNLSI